MIGLLLPFQVVPVAAGGGTSKGLILRGSLLPKKTPEIAQRLAPVRLASLTPATTSDHRDNRLNLLPRLKYANFRYSTKPAADKPKGVKLASLRPFKIPMRKRARRFRGAAKGLIKWLAYPGCVPKRLKKILIKLSSRYGDVTVNSTHRSIQHNREVGGAKHSYHLSCQAVDFRLKRNWRAAKRFLKRQAVVGGLKHYGGGRFHIDTGPRRTW